jgi:hypothetical protein
MDRPFFQTDEADGSYSSAHPSAGCGWLAGSDSLSMYLLITSQQ